MKAEELRSALLEVGLNEDEIARLTAVNAKKIFIVKINEMVPPGEEDDPNIPDHLVDLYNRLDTEEIENWGNAIVGTAPKTVRVDKSSIPKKPKRPRGPDGKILKEEQQKRGPKPKDKSHIPEKTETPINYRGRAVKVNRMQCVVEALAIGGYREEILVMADKLFMKKGGGSNYAQTVQNYMDAMKVLKTLGLIAYNQGQVKLKDFKVA